LNPFDAVLLISFGGPQGPADVRPFLENVLRGRRVSPERLEEVAHHYEAFAGVSPITELTRRQARALEARLARDGCPLPVYVGMRNWHPFLHDTLAEMARVGIRRAVGVILAAHRSYSSCLQYRENVAEARRLLSEDMATDVEITYVADWHVHDGFVAASAARVREALEALPADRRDDAHLIFTAHSIPQTMAAAYPYERQILESSKRVAERAGVRDWRLVFQSRSGRPEDPWLGPDVCDYVRARAAELRSIVIHPIGFVSDHVEVLYDLDREAAAVCRELGVPMARAATVNDHPEFIRALAERVMETMARYRSGMPLTLIGQA
jgi:ferrochelatase